MLKKYTINTFIIVLLIFSTGCDNWLDLRPVNGVVKQDYWQTKEQVRTSMFGAYASLIGNYRGRQATEQMFLWGELRGYMVALNQGANFNDNQIIFGNIQPVNNISDWSAFYGTINLCNLVVDYAPLAMQTDETFLEADMKNYVAEARALRALMYFYLVRTFGDVPLVIEAVDTDEDDLAPVKSTKDEVLIQILEDLRLAEPDIYLQHSTLAQTKGRMTRYAVNAMQADVHLWMENYQEAIIAADKVLQGPFALVAQEDWLRSLFIQGNSVESIFEIQYQAPQNNPFFNMFSTNLGRRFLAYPSVLQDIYGFDANNPEDLDVRSIDATIKPSGEIFKYISLGPNSRRTQTESYANWIVYRLADVMLMKAEALSQTGQGAEALEIVDVIRTRGGAAMSTLQLPGPTDDNAILRYILEERARELAFEGKRWYDLLRVAKMNNYSNIDVLIAAAVENAPVTNLNSIINQLRDTRSHYLPIYNVELNANPNLVQNPYYIR